MSMDGRGEGVGPMNPNLHFIDADVLIIGSGIAGLEAALAVSKSGREPLLVSKSPMGKANNTILAGGDTFPRNGGG